MKAQDTNSRGIKRGCWGVKLASEYRAGGLALTHGSLSIQGGLGILNASDVCVRTSSMEHMFSGTSTMKCCLCVVAGDAM